MAGRLTKRTVDTLKGGQIAWDGELRGFGIRRRESGGAPVYVVKYRAGRGRNAPQRWYTLGTHGSPWTPDTARTEARRLLAEAAAGRDPARAPEARRRLVTVSELCDRYLKAAPTLILARKGRPKKASSLVIDASNIQRHVKPLIGKKSALDLSKDDIERFQRQVAQGRTAAKVKTKPRGLARVRGGAGIAARSVAVLGSVFTWATREGICTVNPVRGVELFQAPRKERFLSGEEIRRLGEALGAAEKAGTNPYAIAALRLLVLTGARKMEILGLQWPWVDFERGTLRLPDSKTGAKAIPLGAPALAVLRTLPRIQGSPYVFPATKGNGHLIGLPCVWQGIRTTASLENVRLHDLRHSFASVAVAGGDSLYLVGKVLGHSAARTTEKYAHVHDDPLRAVADRAARRIAAALDGGKGTVVKLRKRGR